MNNLLGGLMASLIGTTIILNGASLDVANILDTTKGVVTEANLHQVRTALELYYFEQGEYPQVDKGGNLADVLAQEGYLRNKPGSFSNFEYSPLEDGQDYLLNIDEKKDS